MKCLYCTSEALPFIASGGLGDVAGSLPYALCECSIDCRVIMPLYEEIPKHFKDSMKFITSIRVPVSWRYQYCGIFESNINGVIYYFIDNQYYFKRKGMYSHCDDIERFAFLSRAILEIIPHISFKPDIIHTNDWQTALVPIYYNLFYCNNDWYRGIKTIFTIHNIQYQGKCGMELAEDTIGIPKGSISIVEFEKSINLAKGAIEIADKITTVSPTYAEELLDPWFSHGLDQVLKDRSCKISGILNGIDTENYNPETDKYIYTNYSIRDMRGKAQNKKSLQSNLCLDQNPKIPIISMVTRMVPHKGLDLVIEVLNELMCEEPIQFVILGTGDRKYETFFQNIKEKYTGRIAVSLGFIPELSHKIYASSDIFLMPSKSEPCGLAQMIALRYGTIPIVRETGGLNDSISDNADGTGTGFTFKSFDASDMLDTIKRSIKEYHKSDTWKVLVERAMKNDNSWTRSAGEYIRLYRNLIDET